MVEYLHFTLCTNRSRPNKVPARDTNLNTTKEPTLSFPVPLSHIIKNGRKTLAEEDKCPELDAATVAHELTRDSDSTLTKGHEIHAGKSILSQCYPFSTRFSSLTLTFSARSQYFLLGSGKSVLSVRRW